MTNYMLHFSTKRLILGRTKLFLKLFEKQEAYILRTQYCYSYQICCGKARFPKCNLFKRAEHLSSFVIYTAVSTKVVPQHAQSASDNVDWYYGQQWFGSTGLRFTVLSLKERECMNTRVCAASFSNAEIPWASINQVQNHLTHDNFPHYRIHFYAFVRKPFSNQLYFRLQSQNKKEFLFAECDSEVNPQSLAINSGCVVLEPN